jgi:uncharacterized protein
MTAALLLLAVLGHACLWIGLVNRLHAVGVRRWIVNLLTDACLLCAVLIPIGVAWFCDTGPERFATLPWRPVNAETAVLLVTAYFVLCWAAAFATLLRLVWLRAIRPRPPLVRFHGRRRVEINPAAAAATAGELAHHFAVRLPLNEILQLEVTRWTVDVPRMAPALDGLSIVHLSDFHFTGRVGKAYFREVVRASNELRPDLVCLTGDLVDRPACLDWIPGTFGQLSARHGVYFILGNHDRKADAGGLRRTLEQAGLVDLGGRWLTIEINGATVALAGNERPWFKHQGDLNTPTPTGSLRIVLAHSPDRLAWARAQRADLMLAGHTHGGQICIPPLGAIFSPTAAGVKYISGVYYAPPTILHVTRGISGDTPIRWNCRPEIAHLRLRAGRPL